MASERQAEGSGAGIPRRALLRAAAGAAGLAFTAGAVGCAGRDSGEAAATEIPLADLPVGGRVRVMHGEIPVEVIRTSDGVVARSLWCTHSGCEVKWMPQDQSYLCPCHDGVYDAVGRPIGGPPPRSLREVAITVSDTSVILGEIGSTS